MTAPLLQQADFFGAPAARRRPKRREPRQRRWRSEQAVPTPREFLPPVAERFGVITFDLAATPANSVVGGYHFGPGSMWGVDALVQSWHRRNGLLWLNPPFETIGPWAAKCREEAAAGATIAMLTPASVGSIWFAEHVHGRALVLGLSPRLKFVGCKHQYPKDLMLSVYGPCITPGFDVWRWKP